MRLAVLRSRLVRWLAALVAVLVAVIGVTAAVGGFAVADESLPEVEVGERIVAGRFAWTVHGASLPERDQFGEPFEEGEEQLLLDVTIEALDHETAIVPGQLLVVTFDGSHQLPIGDGDGAYQTVQPGLPQRFQIPLKLAGATPDDDLAVLVAGERYGWSNLVNSGPAWSGTVPTAFVQIPWPPKER